MSRLVALLILVLPGAVAALGIKLMRDALFGHAFSPFPSLFLQGAAGLAFFCSAFMFWPGLFCTEIGNAIKSARGSGKKSCKKSPCKKGLFQSSGSIVLAMD